MEKVRFFTGNSNKELAEEVSKYTKLPLGKITVDRFPNMETRVEVMESVRGCKVFLLQSTSPPVNENLMELLIMIDALSECHNPIFRVFKTGKKEDRKGANHSEACSKYADHCRHEQAGYRRPPFRPHRRIFQRAC